MIEINLRFPEETGGSRECEAYLDQEIRTFDIDFHNLVEVVLGGVLEIFHGQDAGVGDQDIDLAKVLDGGVDHGLDTANAACICLNGQGTVAADLLDELIGRGGVGSVVDDD